MAVAPQANAAGYAKSWQQFRRWYLTSWILFALWIPIGMAMVRSTERLREPGLVIVPVMLLWMAAWLTCTAVAHYWPCPHCGKRFFITPSGWRMPILFTSRCPHCGLAKYALSGDKTTA